MNSLQSSSDERMFGMLIYVSSFFTVFIGPVIIWLIKRDDSPFVDRVGRNYLNFLISYTIWAIIATILVFVFIGIILLWVIGIAVIVFTIIGAIKAYEGEVYLPPFSLRIL